MNHASQNNQYKCQACSAVYGQATSLCDECGRWDTIQPILNSHSLARVIHHPASYSSRNNRTTFAKEITKCEEPEELKKFPSGTPAFDRVLGGGVIPGKTNLVSGMPGQGKSTLLLRVAADMAETGRRVIYATSEEEEVDILRRAKRTDAIRKGLYLLPCKNFSDIESNVLQIKPDILILDSISALLSDPEGRAGSTKELETLIGQITNLIRNKNKKIAAFIISHVRKDLKIAGPESMQHMVDAIFYLEKAGSLTLLRPFKNRNGQEKTALFEMTEKGMIAVENPSERFLSDRVPGLPGSIVSAICDSDSKTLLFEVQALVGEAKPKGNARISTNGLDKERTSQVIDILCRSLDEIKADHLLSTRDTRLNIPGGIPVDDPAVDLAVALAMTSSLLDRPFEPGFVAFGEIGLASEIRSVDRAGPRIQESFDMGFTKAMIPQGSKLTNIPAKMEVIEVTTLTEAIKLSLLANPSPKSTTPIKAKRKIRKRTR